MNIRTVLVIGLAAGVLALSGCTTKVVTTEGAVPLHTVTTSGEGKALAAPDMAEMFFGTTVVATDAKEALGQANETAEKITAAVKGSGVADEDIQTANVSVWPDQNNEGGKTVITGYRASIQVRVKIRDIDEIGTVIGAASDAGANEIGGPSFMLDDDDAVRSEAIELAIADARARAEVMAKAAGKTLGEIISVSEAGVSAPIYGGSYYLAAEDAARAVAIEPGQLDIMAHVTVVFELK
ncbi:MAG: SIMPL domain-containing protein [Coriobacteriia bacterium]|nr:SIMPL domain-containing protein [Coriobacteriia bacterium]